MKIFLIFLSSFLCVCVWLKNSSICLTFCFLLHCLLNQTRGKLRCRGTVLHSQSHLFIYLFMPDNRIMKTTNNVAFEILLFDVKKDNAVSCTRLLPLSAQFKAVPLSLILNLWIVDPSNQTSETCKYHMQLFFSLGWNTNSNGVPHFLDSIQTSNSPPCFLSTHAAFCIHWYLHCLSHFWQNDTIFLPYSKAQLIGNCPQKLPNKWVAAPRSIDSLTMRCTTTRCFSGLHK